MRKIGLLVRLTMKLHYYYYHIYVCVIDPCCVSKLVKQNNADDRHLEGKEQKTRSHFQKFSGLLFCSREINLRGVKEPVKACE